jgi:hypothetical protein
MSISQTKMDSGQVANGSPSFPYYIVYENIPKVNATEHKCKNIGIPLK